MMTSFIFWGHGTLREETKLESAYNRLCIKFVKKNDIFDPCIVGKW